MYISYLVTIVQALLSLGSDGQCVSCSKNIILHTIWPRKRRFAIFLNTLEKYMLADSQTYSIWHKISHKTSWSSSSSQNFMRIGQDVSEEFNHARRDARILYIRLMRSRTALLAPRLAVCVIEVTCTCSYPPGFAVRKQQTSCNIISVYHVTFAEYLPPNRACPNTIPYQIVSLYQIWPVLKDLAPKSL